MQLTQHKQNTITSLLQHQYITYTTQNRYITLTTCTTFLQHVYSTPYINFIILPLRNLLICNNLTGCSLITTVNLNPGFDPPRRLLLQYLDLTDCCSINDEGLKTIVVNCPQLVYLYLRRCVQITGECRWYAKCEVCCEINAKMYRRPVVLYSNLSTY